MLAVRRSRLSSGRPSSQDFTKQKVLFYAANNDGYSSSPTSSTSCETSLDDSSVYMEMGHHIDHIEISPGIESTSSSQSSKLLQESVLKTNKYCGSAYVKARKQRQEMKDATLEYDDPPLDHLHLLAPSFESDSSNCQPSKLVKEATLKIKQRDSVGEVVIISFGESTTPPPPLPSTSPTTSSPWPQSGWKIGSDKTNATAVLKKYLKNTYEPKTTDSTSSIRDSIVNNIKARSEERDVTPVIRMRNERRIRKVKAMARSRKERNDRKAKEQQNDAPKSVKSSKTFKDFVDHLLMVSATNLLCHSPESTPSSCEKETLPPVEAVNSKKKVSWQGDPGLPKPVLRRRSNSPDPPIGPNLPKPVLKRHHHFTTRFSSRPIFSSNAPYDEDPVFSSPGGWKSGFYWPNNCESIVG